MKSQPKKNLSNFTLNVFAKFVNFNPNLQIKTSQNGVKGGGASEEARGGREEGQERRNRPHSRVHVSGKFLVETRPVKISV